MMGTLRIVAALGVIALGVALASSPLSARQLTGLGGSALLAVSSLNEPGVHLLWGALLAGLARVIQRRPSSN